MGQNICRSDVGGQASTSTPAGCSPFIVIITGRRMDLLAATLLLCYCTCYRTTVPLLTELNLVPRVNNPATAVSPLCPRGRDGQIGPECLIHEASSKVRQRDNMLLIIIPARGAPYIIEHMCRCI